MLAAVHSRLASKSIVLASQSPRRLELLSKLGLQFTVKPSTFEENLDKSAFASPRDYVVETARLKAEDVRSVLTLAGAKPDIVIGCDTVVDEADAIATLTSLSGNKHTVYSGVAVLLPDGETHTFHASTEVVFAELSQEIIEAYVGTGEPMDKAGSYGIQGIGGSLIKGINGCYFNVMGFPVNKFCEELLVLLKSGALR